MPRRKGSLDLPDRGADVKRGLGALVENGFAPGGRPPLGYIAEYHEVGTGREIRRWSRWIIDPATEAIARQRWQMRLQRAPYRQIAAATRFEHASARLSEFFGNPAYCGFPKWYLNYSGLDIADCTDLTPIIPPYVTVREWLQCRQLRTERSRIPGNGQRGRILAPQR